MLFPTQRRHHGWTTIAIYKFVRSTALPGAVLSSRTVKKRKKEILWHPWLYPAPCHRHGWTTSLSYVSTVFVMSAAPHASCGRSLFICEEEATTARHLVSSHGDLRPKVTSAL
ncbi:hypothetical protein BRADI_4g25535v3 [Brachypodium distachyon]|uniref:Uncharacterized protein n=1 Tax=Brachypodium distachyon TaxID=15368 RepID=A0A0Q3H7R6_BRADI|nr:hypothetical protein BRADI_4g25535v3 [Brachypodium distachyon]